MPVQLPLADWEAKEWSHKLRILKNQLKELEGYIIEADLEDKPPFLAFEYLTDIPYNDDLSDLAEILEQACFEKS